MNALFALAYAEVPGFPAGTVLSGIQVTITGTSAGNTTPLVGTVAPGTDSAEFTLDVADSYTYSVVGVNAGNTALGTPVTGSFTISAPATVSLNLPSVVTVTQSAT